MANINFPNDPSVNDIFTVGGKSYKWDGVKWVAKTTVDKSDVGLGNVQNFSIADQAEAEAGSVNNKYMTPLRTAQAIAELGSAAQTFTLTIETTDWSLEETEEAQWENNYVAVMTLSGLLDTDVPIVELDLSDEDNETANDIIATFGKVFAWQVTDDDEITFYANSEPQEDIKVHILVVK